MRKQTKQPGAGIIIGILSTLFFISLGLIITINWKGLYHYDVDHLGISETSGYEKSVIYENYDALIDYCSPFFKGELSFPSLPSSPQGIHHFAEVKNIFVAFYYILFVSLILLIPAVWYQCRKKQYIFLKISALTTIILPLFVGGACAINFDRAFYLFHKLFFRNDDWLFDPLTDPIINLLPSEFFLHCAVAIILIVLAGSLLQYIAYRIIIHRQRIH